MYNLKFALRRNFILSALGWRRLAANFLSVRSGGVCVAVEGASERFFLKRSRVI